MVTADDPLARAGLAALLSQEPDIDVVGQAPDSTAMNALIDDLGPDVIVLDAGWASETALDALRDLGAGAPPIVVLLPDEVHASQAFAAGARAILPRDASGDVIATTLSAAVEGLTVLGPRFADAVLTAPGRRADNAAPDLTPRTAGAEARRRGAVQQRDRLRLGHQRPHGQIPRQLHSREARRSKLHRGRDERGTARAPLPVVVSSAST